MVKVNDYFDVGYGNNLPLSALEENNDGINFVSRISKNNGVSAKVKIIKGEKLNPPMTITVAVGGSVMESFLQAFPYYTGYHILVLSPKIKLDERQLLFYCLCLRYNKYKYSYGRQANRTLKEIEIPSVKELPSWLEDSKYPNIPDTNPIENKNIDLKKHKWKRFKISDLFYIEKGERIVKNNRTNGDIPLITATSENNGVVNFLSFEDFKNKKKVFENKITVDMFFNVFYHDYKYFSDDNVHTLIPKFEESNQYVLIFITSILRKLSYKYDYGRQLRLRRIELEEIELPVNEVGKPDWKFIENYIKTLNYSKGLLD